MSQVYPRIDDIDSRDGTAAHEVAEHALRLYVFQHAPTGAAPLAANGLIDVGGVASNGVVITQDIFDGAMVFVNDCVAEIENRGGLGVVTIGIESKLQAPSVHELSNGTVDFWLYDPNAHELLVNDLKFGWGVVEAFENWQGVNYLAAVIDHLWGGVAPEGTLRCRIRITQPRVQHTLGPVRSWFIPEGNVRAHINVLSTQAHKALGPDAELQTGAHCRYCEALHACPAAMAAGVQLFEASGRPLPDPGTPGQLAARYKLVTRAHRHLDSLKNALEVELIELLTRGAAVDDYALDRTVGGEVWARPNAEVIALGKLLGVSIDKGEPITPNQARKAGISADVVATYSKRKSGKIKLIEHNKQHVSEVFS